MTDALRTELILPGDTRMMRLVQDYIRGLAALARIPEEETQSLAQGVWEACRHRLQNAFDPDEPRTFTLVGELTPVALTLMLCDRGLPTDQSLEEAASASDLLTSEEAYAHGHGLDLINHCVDEVRWLNHGVEGNELRLTKYLTGICHLEPSPAGAATQQQPITASEGSSNYTIRLLRPGDGIRLAQLMYRVYGYSYSNEDFYYPERLDHNLASGRHVGVVAVAYDGEIVGHAGIERPDFGPLAELGQLAVAPAHRGQGLQKLMGNQLQEEIQRLGLKGLYGEAVTIHTASQQASESRGLRVCAIKLLDWQAQFKEVETLHPGIEPETAPQRESMVLYFKYLTPPGLARVCAPSQHREMLARIYAHLGVEVEFLETSNSTGFGNVAVHYDKAVGVGTIQVNHIGRDTLPEIYQGWQDLTQIIGAAVVGLDLPLAQGGTPSLCEFAEGKGFLFSGVRPHFAPDGDFLRLQYLRTEPDLDTLCLFSPFAQELLHYILKEKKRRQ